MPEEQQQLALAESGADTSETVEVQQTETDTSATDTGEKQAQQTEVAETDEQKNQRVQEEEKQRTEKRSRGVQKRMDELTRDKYAERAAREALEKQNAELLAILKGGRTQAAPSESAPDISQYTDINEYNRDVARYEARQEAKALIEQTSKARQEEQQKYMQAEAERTAIAAYTQRQNEIAKSIPDFHQVMAEGADDITVPDQVLNMIRRLPNGPLVAYHMVKNPALAEQFYSNPPEMHGILLGQLSATLKAPAKVSNAPPPGKPAKANTSTSADNPPEETSAYFAWAEKHMR